MGVAPPSTTHAERPPPLLTVQSETWTRESHGLFDFYSTEIQKSQFTLKGTHNLMRQKFDVEAQKETSFEHSSHLENLIARCLLRRDSYWLYHRQLIDDQCEQVLETKPEEKLWQVVKQTYQPKLQLNCYRLKRRDSIKVGRVRFKIRDIYSPAYKDSNLQEDLNLKKF